MPESRLHRILTENDVLLTRLFVREMARAMGFGESEVTELEITVSELGTNIIKHGNASGEILLQELQEGDLRGIGVEARDWGPGIVNLDEALQGGVSTTGTLGIGLSSIKRLMDEVQVRSEHDGGAVIRAKKWIPRAGGHALSLSVFSRPCQGETLSGDAYFIKQLPPYAVLAVIDALGHGPEAHAVAQQALRVLDDFYADSLDMIIQRCHDRLRQTRGAAMGLCRIHFREGSVEFLGVGNVTLRIYGAQKPVHPMSRNGTLGAVLPSLQVFQCPYEPYMQFIMHSDGISDRFELQSAELRRTPQELALHLLTNHGKNYDDATVLVAR